jgi:hypothetical protein
VFTCNTFYLDKAYDNQTYAYFFTVPPGIHGEDIPYTYYNGAKSTSVVSPTVAIALQEYITNFAEVRARRSPAVARLADNNFAIEDRQS